MFQIAAKNPEPSQMESKDTDFDPCLRLIIVKS